MFAKRWSKQSDYLPELDGVSDFSSRKAALSQQAKQNRPYKIQQVSVRRFAAISVFLVLF